MVHIKMLTLLLTTLNVIHSVTGCIAGVKFVPPASLVIQPVRKSDSKASQSESSSACVPCRRDEPSRTHSSRFLWPAATTTAPCCPDTDSSTTTTTTATTNYLTNATGCGVANTRIIGGEDAVENQFPWQCAILTSDNRFWGCGATLLSCDPVIIVSAAHCFKYPGEDVPNGKKVSCGAHRLGNGAGAAPLDSHEERLTITEIIVHPDFANEWYHENDIAVIKVDGSFSCSPDKIYPACLPNTEDTIVSGWGIVSPAGHPDEWPSILQWVKLEPVTDITCQDFYEDWDYYYYNDVDWTITANMICAGGSLDETPCYGDAGGPLVTRAKGVDSGYSLIGVDSFGDYCEGKKPTVFSEVSHFLPWIAEQYGLKLP